MKYQNLITKQKTWAPNPSSYRITEALYDDSAEAGTGKEVRASFEVLR